MLPATSVFDPRRHHGAPAPAIPAHPPAPAANVPYLPAEETSAQKGPRLPSENEDRGRTQSPVPPQSKGQIQSHGLTK